MTVVEPRMSTVWLPLLHLDDQPGVTSRDEPAKTSVETHQVDVDVFGVGAALRECERRQASGNGVVAGGHGGLPRVDTVTGEH